MRKRKKKFKSDEKKPLWNSTAKNLSAKFNVFFFFFYIYNSYCKTQWHLRGKGDLSKTKNWTTKHLHMKVEKVIKHGPKGVCVLYRKDER